MASVGRGGAGPIKGKLGMADQVGGGGGRGSCGRDRELEEEPTLLQDSEPAGEKGKETKIQTVVPLSFSLATELFGFEADP